MAIKDWMEVETQDQWTPALMKDFIWEQNNHCYDGGSAKKHSAEKLMSFAGITDPAKVKQFNRAYKSLYKDEK